MQRLKVNLGIKVSSVLPNYITLLCGIILITFVTEKMYLEYLIPFCSLNYFLIIKRGKIQGSVGKKMFILFGIFIAIQFAGLLKNVTVYSVKNILTSGSVFLIIYTILSGKFKIQKEYIKIYYFMACIVLFFLSKIETNSKNTLAGCAIFLYLLLIVLMEWNKSEERKRTKQKGCRMELIVMIGMLPAIIFSLVYSSRTALFTGIFIILLYFAFYLFDLNARTYQRVFGPMLFFIIAGLVIYINAKNYSWYDSINTISLKYFGKNIDSSRSYLWRTSLAELKGLNLILGMGTGITPFIKRYANSSFHNSFIQTLMQNGVVGLLCLIVIFWILWKHIVQITDRSLRALLMAAFFAVVAYNCMECCLLQNKFFLGMIQWMILSLGICYAETYKYKYQEDEIFLFKEKPVFLEKGLNCNESGKMVY